MKTRGALLGAVPAVVFGWAVAAFIADFCKTNVCGIGDGIAAAIVFLGLLNGFFVISLILFYVWWFKRVKVLLILSGVAFAPNALFWIVGFAFGGGGSIH